MKLKIHPAAEIFNMMDDRALRELADDIKANGQREWIVMWKDQILDGRNRLKACEMAGVEPDISEIEDDNLDPVAYVLSANLHRRHLNESQRAMVAGRLKEYYQPAAKERQRKGGKEAGKGRPKQVPANLPEPIGSDSRDEAGRALNVGGRTVEHAATVLANGSADLIAAVDRGEVSVSKAAKVARDTPKKEQLAAAKAKKPARKERSLFDDLVRLWGKADAACRHRFRLYIDDIK